MTAVAVDATAAGLLAIRLNEAAATRRPIPRLTDEYPSLSGDDGYAIQAALRALQTRGGIRVGGKKTGLTSKAKQVEMGVHEPIAGYLLASTILDDGVELAADDFIHPRIEPEIAFILKRRLEGPGVTIAQVIAATECILPAIEVIDSRYDNFKFGLGDVIADNCSAARVVLGSTALSPAGIDLRLIGMTLEKNGELIATGAGAAVLGNPAGAVAWLANQLAARGEAIEAGEVVMPGALSASFDLHQGDSIRVTFDRLGSVTTRCV